ncbi:MAG: UbiD family decarboxylase, partial [Alphaproteobacteria bacterium]
MEELVFEPAGTPSYISNRRAVGWHDLRDWLSLVEAAGELKRITARVDPDEELSAITYMASRSENSPALLFENLADDRFGTRILSNMLGASKERYALAVGIDPDLSITQMISATREIMKERIAPVLVEKDVAAVNEIILRGEDIDLTALPVPKFWPGDGGRYIGTGNVTLTRDPQSGRINVGVYRQMLHGPARVG